MQRREAGDGWQVRAAGGSGAEMAKETAAPVRSLALEATHQENIDRKVVKRQ